MIAENGATAERVRKAAEALLHAVCGEDMDPPETEDIRGARSNLRYAGILLGEAARALEAVLEAVES
jgi:hypothetical protein